MSLIAKIIENYESNINENIFNPKEFVEFLLDEIKLKRLSATIKGGVWYIIGVLIGKFSIMLNSYKIEINDVIFNEFKILVNSTNKFEFKAVSGILKALIYLLDDPQLTGDQSNI